MAQKVIEGDNDTCQYLPEVFESYFLRLLKIRTTHFSHFFRSRSNSISFRILSHLRILELRKKAVLNTWSTSYTAISKLSSYPPVLSRGGICMRFWDDFKLVQNLDHLSKLRAVNISNRVSVRILSYLRVFGVKKWAISDFWHQFEVESSQNLMHMPSRDNISFDDFLSHLKDPRVEGPTVRLLPRP